MKNGRGLYGHRRIIEPLGEQPSLRRPYSPGYRIKCICGWIGGIHSVTLLAQKEYRDHIDFQIDQCLHHCKRCKVDKPISQMKPDYRYICKSCDSKRINGWIEDHPSESLAHKRKHSLMKRYGISPKEADSILESQNGVCAICKQKIDGKIKHGPYVDHDHDTGKVRGILCFHCNAGLGLFKDNPGILISAAEYLNRKGAK
jgi:hypothetical protein